MEASVADTPNLEGLMASGPNDEYRDKLMLFGQFVGHWEAELTVHNRDGTTEVEKAEWRWGWILEGRAVQDIWIIPRRSDRARSKFERHDYGASIRFYDLKLDAWRSVWLSPPNGELITFIARQIGDEIVLAGNDMDGTLMQWIFSRVTRNSYHWRRMHSYDGGNTWQLYKEMDVKRVQLRR